MGTSIVDAMTVALLAFLVGDKPSIRVIDRSEMDTAVRGVVS